MNFAEQIESMIPDGGGDHYHDGFYEARDNAVEIADIADKLIKELFDALCDRHADDLVDELREQYGL